MRYFRSADRSPICDPERFLIIGRRPSIRSTVFSKAVFLFPNFFCPLLFYKMTSWSKDFLLEFIELFREQEALWKMKHDDYSNKLKRGKCLDVLVRKVIEIDASVNREAVHNKIKNIRTVFRKEHKKVTQSRISGCGTEEAYTPRLWYYSNLLFLEDQDDYCPLTSSSLCEELRKFKEEVEESDGIEISQTSLDNLHAEEAAVDKESCAVQSPAPSISHHSIESPQNITAKKNSISHNEEPAPKKAKLSCTVDAVAGKANALQENADKANASQLTTDELEVFGKMVIAHLKRLPINTALQCQSDMLNYLFQKRLGQSASLSATTPAQVSEFILPPS